MVDTTNFNGKTWLNEGGEIVSYAEHVVERFTPAGPDKSTMRRPSPIRSCTRARGPSHFRSSAKKFELTEAACHEEDHDLPHLKALKDAAAAKKK